MSNTPCASFDPNRVDQIVGTLAAMLQRRSIARELETLKQLAVFPEQIDELLIAAINASLSLEDEEEPAEMPPLRIDERRVQPKSSEAA